MDGLEKMATPDIPVWQRAHETLNSIYNDMDSRVKEIDSAISRLHGEREAIISVISRIAAGAPQPAVPYNANSNQLGAGQMVQSSPPRW